MILRFNVRGGINFSLDPLQSRIQDTDNDGLPEIVDEWGNPVRFYRWPTDLLAYYIEGTKSAPLGQSSLRTSIRTGI